MVIFDVVTFGSGVMDVFTESKINEKWGRLDLKLGEKYLINNLRFDVGGGGTNVAVAFSRLGFKTGCICGVGNDTNGQEILKLLQKEKVKFLGKKYKTNTGYSVIINSKKRNRTLLTYKGASDEIEIKDIKNFQTNWIYYSSLLGKSIESQKQLAKKLHTQNIKLAFNPSSYLIKNTDISEILKISEILILNKEEGIMLSKKYKKKGDILKALHSLGPKIVVITDKTNPIICFDGEQKYTAMPNKKITAIERTGAGDAFSAGFVAGRIAGFPIKKCMGLGIKEGEAVIKHFGAKNNLIKRKLKKLK